MSLVELVGAIAARFSWHHDGPFLAFMLVILICVVIGTILTNRDWNRGYCRECGNPWRHFDMDSQGGHGYTCGRHYMWRNTVGREAARADG